MSPDIGENRSGGRAVAGLIAREVGRITVGLVHFGASARFGTDVCARWATQTDEWRTWSDEFDGDASQVRCERRDVSLVGSQHGSVRFSQCDHERVDG